MEVRNISIKDLVPYDRNTKKHDKTQINNVAESIKQYGFVQPIVIDKDNVVVIGHCRLLAAKQLKMKEVPCVCVEDLTEEQVKALAVEEGKYDETDMSRIVFLYNVKKQQFIHAGGYWGTHVSLRD